MAVWMVPVRRQTGGTQYVCVCVSLQEEGSPCVPGNVPSTCDRMPRPAAWSLIRNTINELMIWVSVCHKIYHLIWYGPFLSVCFCFIDLLTLVHCSGVWMSYKELCRKHFSLLSRYLFLIHWLHSSHFLQMQLLIKCSDHCNIISR